MKAIVQDRFGPPEVLRLADTDLPEVGADDVLVRVHAAALNPADWHILRGDPLVARLMGVGLTKPKARVAGIDAAGVVEAAGANVRGLRNGDEVLGFCRGAFAEYACAAADLVVPKPAGLTFEQAAAVPIAATTALRGIRDVGQVQAGQRVLINGAGGGVGTYAVQIAAALGTEVTGVCSARKRRAGALDRRRARRRLHEAGLHRREDAV
jgi:NADPH:quinone reductase-like Zn-dependent oxidoreductase